MLKKIVRLYLLLGIFVILTACGGGSSSSGDGALLGQPADLSINTTIGNVTGLTVMEIPYGTSLEEFRDSVTVDSQSVFEIYEVDGITVASDLKNSYRLTVTGYDESKESYILYIEPDPAITASWLGFDPESPDYTIVDANFTDGIDGNSNALEFDGSADNLNYLVLPDTEDLTLRDKGSLEVIVKAYSFPVCAGIVSKGESSTYTDEAYGIQLYPHSGSQKRLLFFLYGDSGNWIGLNGTYDLVEDTWYHIVATWDEDNMYLYVNGVLDGTRVNTTGGVRDTDGGLTIGAQLTENYNGTYGNMSWDGVIDRVIVYDRTLTEEEVESKYSDVEALL